MSWSWVISRKELSANSGVPTLLPNWEK